MCPYSCLLLVRYLIPNAKGRQYQSIFPGHREGVSLIPRPYTPPVLDRAVILQVIKNWRCKRCGSQYSVKFYCCCVDAQHRAIPHGQGKDEHRNLQHCRQQTWVCKVELWQQHSNCYKHNSACSIIVDTESECKHNLHSRSRVVRYTPAK